MRFRRALLQSGACGEDNIFYPDENGNCPQTTILHVFLVLVSLTVVLCAYTQIRKFLLLKKLKVKKGDVGVLNVELSASEKQEGFKQDAKYVVTAIRLEHRLLVVKEVGGDDDMLFFDVPVEHFSKV
tara:strand:+ start:377 stop:757 length:381 start_codon:yes stop_codon:yes gene_type:complete